MHGLKTPISQVVTALRLRGEELGLRATARILGTHKNTIAEWERRFTGMKPTLMLYGLCHIFSAIPVSRPPDLVPVMPLTVKVNTIFPSQQRGNVSLRLPVLSGKVAYSGLRYSPLSRPKSYEIKMEAG